MLLTRVHQGSASGWLWHPVCQQWPPSCASSTEEERVTMQHEQKKIQQNKKATKNKSVHMRSFLQGRNRHVGLLLRSLFGDRSLGVLLVCISPHKKTPQYKKNLTTLNLQPCLIPKPKHSTENVFESRKVSMCKQSIHTK